MKKKILIPGALLLLLCATTQAQFTYTGGTLNASQTYDGLGVDSALNPYTIPGTQDDYIGSGGTGSLTVLSGTLTINNDDFKAGVNGGNGTLILGANATLNVNSIASWAPGFSWYGASTSTVIISNNATLNFLVASANEQRLECGGGGASGSLTLNGGAVNVNGGAATPITDGNAQIMFGAFGSPFTLNLNAGTFTDNMPLPFCLSCYYNTMNSTPALAQNTAVCAFNIVNGSLVMTAICPTTDTNKATFAVGTNSYVNFDPSGTGSLSLTNWAATNYAALVASGTIRILGVPTTMNNFRYTNDNGQGVLHLGPVVLITSVTPSNVVYASTLCTLHGAAYGSGVAGATFQWQADGGSNGSIWTNIPGATSTNYSLNTSALNGTYGYQLIAAAAGNFYTSAIVSLTVLPAVAPQIVQDITPVGTITLYVGEGFLFSASFAGPQPIYVNWQHAGDDFVFTNIPNATNNSFTIPSVGLGDAGYYHLHATNMFGYNDSGYAYLIVNTGPPFPTYLWSAPTPFANLNADQILTNFPGTKVAGALVGKNGGNPIIVTNSSADSPIVFAGAGAWASLSGGSGYFTGANTNLTGNANFNTCLNDGYYDAATHVITMNGLILGQQYQVQLFGLDNRSGLNPPISARLVNWQDPNNANDTSETFSMADNIYMLGTFTATNTVMTIQENMLTNSGNFNCLVLRAVGWNPPPYFTLEPQSGVRYVGTNGTLSASAAGDATIPSPTIAYQWQAGPTNGPFTNLPEGAKYAGTATATLTISNLAFSDGLPVYELIAVNGGGSVTSSVAHMYVIPPALVGQWFTGTASLTDVSGYSPAGTHDGYAVGGGSYSFVYDAPPGKSGQSLALNNAGIAIHNSSTLDGAYTNTFDDDINGAMTIACWAKGAPGGWNPWVSKYGENGQGWQLRVNNGSDPCWTIRGTGGTEDMATSTATPNDGAWHHYAGTYSATTGIRNLYVDGVLAATQTGQGPLNPSAPSFLAIGARDQGGNAFQAYFTGEIFDVRVYDYDLTSNQVALLAALPDPVIAGQPPTNTAVYVGFNARISASVKGTPPLTNQWKFNGTNLVDGAYNGTIIIGSTSNVLTIYGVTANNVGVYTLALSNSLGSTVSSNAMLSLLNTAPPPAANLVGAWLTGAANLADQSGYTPGGIHDGYGVTGAGVPASNYAFTTDVPNGLAGQSLQLKGNTAIAIANSSTNDAGYTNTYDDGIANGFSVMFWARGYPGNWNPWVSKYGEGPGWQCRDEGDNADSGFTLRGAGGTVTLGQAVYGNSDDNRGTIASADSNWHFYAGTFDKAAGIRNWYVDGVLSGQVTGIAQYNLAQAEHLTIGGKDQPSGNNFGSIFTGKIYGVRIYNTALSAAQVNYFNSPSAPPPPAFSVKPAVTAGPGGKQIVLTWSYGTLLQATNVAGPWTTNSATPPYTNILNLATPDMFFKLSYP